MQIKIGTKVVGDNCPAHIIAEAGVNHNGDINIAKKLVDAAAKAGVDAVKFQTFRAEGVVTPYAAQARYQAKNTGRTESQYDMIKRLELGYDDFRELKKYCDRKRIVFLSTPHSGKGDVDLVAELCPAIKVGSGDLTNLPILKYMAEKKLPIILATGMAAMAEVREAADLILPINKKLILLHCTTNYPTPYEEVNLRAMLSMKKEFPKLVIGYSDHTEGINIPVAAVALGAKVIEKHFTLDRNMEGPDHKASLEPRELSEMIKRIRAAEKALSSGKKPDEILKKIPGIEKALGDGVKKPYPSEIETAKIARKSIVAGADINKGSTITEEMLAVKRPGTGMAPKHYWEVLGKRAKRDIKKDELLGWNDFQ